MILEPGPIEYLDVRVVLPPRPPGGELELEAKLAAILAAAGGGADELEVIVGEARQAPAPTTGTQDDVELAGVPADTGANKDEADRTPDPSIPAWLQDADNRVQYLEDGLAPETGPESIFGTPTIPLRRPHSGNSDDDERKGEGDDPSQPF